MALASFGELLKERKASAKRIEEGSGGKLMVVHDVADWHGNSIKYATALIYKTANVNPVKWPILTGMTLGEFSDERQRQLLLRKVERHKPSIVVVADIPVNLANPEGTIETLKELSKRAYTVFLDHHPTNRRFEGELRELERGGSFRWVQVSGLTMSLFMLFLTNALLHVSGEEGPEEIVSGVLYELEENGLIVREGTLPSKDAVESLIDMIAVLGSVNAFKPLYAPLMVYLSGNYTDFDPSVYCTVSMLPKRFSRGVVTIAKASVAVAAVTGDPAHPLFTDILLSMGADEESIERAISELSEKLLPLYSAFAVNEHELEAFAAKLFPSRGRVKLFGYYEGDAQSLFKTPLNRLAAEFIERGFSGAVMIANYYQDNRAGGIWKPTIMVLTSPCRAFKWNLLELVRRADQRLGIGGKVVGHPSFALWFLPYEGKSLEEVKRKLPPSEFERIVLRAREELEKLLLNEQ